MLIKREKNNTSFLKIQCSLFVKTCVSHECSVTYLVEIDPEVLENFVNLFSLFYYYLPLEKGVNPSLEQILISFIQGCFVPS